MRNFLLCLFSIFLSSNSAGQISLKNATGSGSGFLVSSDGYIITNYHVVKNTRSVEVYQKNSQGKRAAVIRTDISNDIAILKIECSQCPYVSTKSSSAVKKGNKVYALGYPNLAIQGVESKLTDGIISSTSGILDQPNAFQITNPIQPGNSGGPLFTEDGDVVGLIVAALKDSQNVNYAIKSNYYIELLNSLDSTILKEKQAPKSQRKFSDIVAEMDRSTVLILVQHEDTQKTQPQQSSESPNAPKPDNSPPKQAIRSVANTSWSGYSEFSKAKLADEVTFLPNGNIRYRSKRHIKPGDLSSPTEWSQWFENGTWQQTGNEISIEINNSFSEKRGIIKGNKIEGTAKNKVGATWTWVLYLIEGKPGSVDKDSQVKPTSPPSFEEVRSMSRLKDCAGSEVLNWNNCFGSQKYPNGNVYHGEFRSGLRDGFGMIQILANGLPTPSSIRSMEPVTYIGDFREGRMHGLGKVFYQSGVVVEAEYKDNAFVRRIR